MLLPQLFLQRLNAACLWSDCISGIIVTAAIILSFLSLMTFADFLADQLLRCAVVWCVVLTPSAHRLVSVGVLTGCLRLVPGLCVPMRVRVWLPLLT